MARSRRVWAVLVAGLAILAIAAVPLFASPYSGSGYDASYPQCGATPPTGASFAIIGVTHGRPFSANSCSGTEWKLAGNAGSLYFNTGYASAYAKNVTAHCQSASPTPTGVTGHQLSVLQTAWAIGCSEADYALAAAASAGASPAAWWADIETGNSWSTNTTVNQYTITGIVAELHYVADVAGSAFPVGVYSTPSMWTKIAGTSYVNSGISADWQAGLKLCPSTPTTAGFTLIATGTYAPVWLVQTGTTSVSGTTYDTDTAC